MNGGCRRRKEEQLLCFLPISFSLWFLMSSASSKFPAIMATWREKDEQRDRETNTVHVCIFLTKVVHVYYSE